MVHNHGIILIGPDGDDIFEFNGNKREELLYAGGFNLIEEGKYSPSFEHYPTLPHPFCLQNSPGSF